MKMNWDVFVENTWNSYISVSMKMVGNAQDAEDIVQGVYLSLFKKEYGSYDDYVSVGFKAVHNGALNHLNRVHIKRSSGMLNVTEELEFDNSPNAIDMMQEEYVMDAMKKHLSPEQFGAITGTMAGITGNELSTAYGVCRNTIKTRTHQARDKMKKHPELFGY